MDDDIARFIARYPDAAMITIRPDGRPHTARIEVANVGGRVQSGGSEGLVRTRNLRRDPRCTLFLFGPHPHWLALETTVNLLDGPDAPEHLIRLLQARHGDAAPPGTVLGHDDAVGHDRPYALDEYRQHARSEGGLVYDFEIQRSYGIP